MHRIWRSALRQLRAERDSEERWADVYFRLWQEAIMEDKPKRGGRREGAGRPPKSGTARAQKSVNLTPAAWAALRAYQRPGESESDALERLLTETRSEE